MESWKCLDCGQIIPTGWINSLTMFYSLIKEKHFKQDGKTVCDSNQCFLREITGETSTAKIFKIVSIEWPEGQTRTTNYGTQEVVIAIT